MYNFHLNEKIIFDPTICIFLTINFCENLQEYIFGRKKPMGHFNFKKKKVDQF